MPDFRVECRKEGMAGFPPERNAKNREFGLNRKIPVPKQKVTKKFWFCYANRDRRKVFLQILVQILGLLWELFNGFFVLLRRLSGLRGGFMGKNKTRYD